MSKNDNIYKLLFRFYFVFLKDKCKNKIYDCNRLDYNKS